MSELADSNGRASHLDFLRARHEELARDRVLELDVPGYQGRLVVRYGAVPWATVARSAKLAAQENASPDVLFAANADALIAACREVLFRDDAGELVSVDPNGDARRFDGRLAELLNAGTGSARELLLWVFGGDDGAKTRINQQVGQLLEWLSEVDRDAMETLAGE